MNIHFASRLNHFLNIDEGLETIRAIQHIEEHKGLKMLITQDKVIVISQLDLKRIFDKLLPMKLPKDTPVCHYTILTSATDADHHH